jgi:nucleotide-binding universal stress UspA family protein
MFRRILVPLDGSTLSETVVPHVEKLISETNAEVTLLRVAESPRPIGTTTVESGGVRDVVTSPTVGEPTIEERTVTREGETQPQAEQRIKDELETYLAGAARGFVAQGVLTERKVLFGDPVDNIVDYANRERFDLIAMATHGRSGLARLLAGSVASRVLERTNLPVLLVRPPELNG